VAAAFVNQQLARWNALVHLLISGAIADGFLTRGYDQSRTFDRTDFVHPVKAGHREDKALDEFNIVAQDFFDEPGDMRGVGIAGRKSVAMVSIKKERKPWDSMRGIQLAAWLCLSPGLEANSRMLNTRSGLAIASHCGR
jgi:hypothetical protein